MAKIFITQAIPASGPDKLRAAGHEVVMNENLLTKAELITALKADRYDAVISLLTDTIDAEVMSASPNTKIVANYAVGYNNINVPEVTHLGMKISNTPDVLTDTVAEFTLAAIFAITKRIVEADKYMRGGHYTHWGPKLLLGIDLQGKTLGVVGAGRIGYEVAKKAVHGLGMKIAYYDLQRSAHIEEVAPEAAYYDQLEDLLAVADVVTLHVPLLPSTTHLMNKDTLQKMKPEAYLVNTARGPIIKEDDLVEVLESGHLAGVFLDVFENEPAVDERLKAIDRVIMTPHIASASLETREQMSMMAADNVLAVLNGGEPNNPVTA